MNSKLSEAKNENRKRTFFNFAYFLKLTPAIVVMSMDINIIPNDIARASDSHDFEGEATVFRVVEKLISLSLKE